MNALQAELNKYLTEPSEAAFAVVEEFVDQIIRAKGVEEQWGDITVACRLVSGSPILRRLGTENASWMNG